MAVRAMKCVVEYDFIRSGPVCFEPVNYIKETLNIITCVTLDICARAAVRIGVAGLVSRPPPR
jgi:hypothetical protein